MKKALSLITGCAIALAVCSCGEKHTAKSTVEQFLTTHLAAGGSPSVSIERLDSTNYLQDSTIAVLQQAAVGNALYKKGVAFAQRRPKERLVWVVATFDNGGKEVRQTFYLTRDCQQVVAVKP